MGGMLFFAMGLDREVLRLFAHTLDRIPAGAYALSTDSVQAIIRLGMPGVVTGIVIDVGPEARRCGQESANCLRSRAARFPLRHMPDRRSTN